MGLAFLEEEDHSVTLHDQMVDAHGLLLELDEEISVLTDPGNTHIGIGFAFTKEQVRVVELVGRKNFIIDSLNKTEDGSVEALGRMVDDSEAIYAARVAALSKLSKDIAVVGPPDITFNKDSGEFKITIPKKDTN